MSDRRVGTVSRGIRCPIIREGDDLARIVTDSVLEAAQAEGFELRDRDVVALTESIVARAQGNYCSVKQVRRRDCGSDLPHSFQKPLRHLPEGHRHGLPQDRADALLSFR